MPGADPVSIQGVLAGLGGGRVDAERGQDGDHRLLRDQRVPALPVPGGRCPPGMPRPAAEGGISSGVGPLWRRWHMPSSDRVDTSSTTRRASSKKCPPRFVVAGRRSASAVVAGRQRRLAAEHSSERPSPSTPLTKDSDDRRPSDQDHRGRRGPPDPGPTSWAATAGVVLLLTLLLSVLLTAFAWPAVRSGLQDIPLAVAGPEPAVNSVVTALNEQRPGAFVVQQVPDQAVAERAIRDRDVYGAVVLGQGPPLVLTASAAGPAVAQGLQQLAQALSAEQSGAAQAVVVTDLVAAPADDPRGVGLAAGALPLVIGGIAAAGTLTVRVRGASRRFVGAAGVAILAGVVLTAILQFWLGSLAGPYWQNAAVVALAVAAIAYPLLGLEWLLGLPGLGLGAAVMMLLGNPLSGLTSAPEMLPSGWGALGQLLPPGATGSLLRSVAFFDGAAAGRPLVVLLGWLGLGLALCALGAVRTSRSRQSLASTPLSVVAGVQGRRR